MFIFSYFLQCMCITYFIMKRFLFLRWLLKWLSHHSYPGFKLRIWDAKSSPQPLTPSSQLPSWSHVPKPHPTLDSTELPWPAWGRNPGRSCGLLAHLFEESDDILIDLWEADNDVVHEDVIEGGMVSALPPGLMQDQIPAVHGWEEVLVLPVETKTAQVGFVETVIQIVFCSVTRHGSLTLMGSFKLGFILTHSQVEKRILWKLEWSSQGHRAVLGPKLRSLSLSPTPSTFPLHMAFATSISPFWEEAALPRAKEYETSCV